MSNVGPIFPSKMVWDRCPDSAKTDILDNGNDNNGTEHTYARSNLQKQKSHKPPRARARAPNIVQCTTVNVHLQYYTVTLQNVTKQCKIIVLLLFLLFIFFNNYGRSLRGVGDASQCQRSERFCAKSMARGAKYEQIRKKMF